MLWLPYVTFFLSLPPLERNLNPKVACLKRREDEKNIEMPKGHVPSGLPDLLDYPQIMSHPNQHPVSL